VKNAREISRNKRRRGGRGKNRVREEFDFALAVGGRRAEFVKNACERARKKRKRGGRETNRVHAECDFALVGVLAGGRCPPPSLHSQLLP